MRNPFAARSLSGLGSAPLDPTQTPAPTTSSMNLQAYKLPLVLLALAGGVAYAWKTGHENVVIGAGVAAAAGAFWLSQQKFGY